MGQTMTYTMRIECEWCGKHAPLYEYSNRQYRLCVVCLLKETEDDEQ